MVRTVARAKEKPSSTAQNRYLCISVTSKPLAISSKKPADLSSRASPGSTSFQPRPTLNLASTTSGALADKRSMRPRMSGASMQRKNSARLRARNCAAPKAEVRDELLRVVLHILAFSCKPRGLPGEPRHSSTGRRSAQPCASRSSCLRSLAFLSSRSVPVMSDGINTAPRLTPGNNANAKIGGKDVSGAAPASARLAKP
mmetsp:Transcript_56445/g.157336  ORF Transcript_56445/g.157336 Transcript_56445/m.157336 type:complete len:200 (-) Transcript_56445:310-909(-)